MNAIYVVELTPDEQALFSAVTWSRDGLIGQSHEDTIAELERVKELVESILHRNAVPTIRLDFFTKPELNLGGRGRSRKQIFEKNGASGEAILRHPHFVAYAWYFIYGPKLPKATIDGFRRILIEDRGTTSMVLDQICGFVRQEVRRGKLSHESPDEFAKVAFELDRCDLAEVVRKHAKSALR